LFFKRYTAEVRTLDAMRTQAFSEELVLVMRKGVKGSHQDTAAPIKSGIPRPIEVIIALAGLIVSAPLIALSAVAILLASPGPVFFRQDRVGRKGRVFVLYKLRTMRLAGVGPQVTASDDARVTAVGRLLRKTKLDELPEFWNIFKGDMSLIGPRPEVPRYVDLENPMWRLVLEARPGITDPMTLRLRNEETLLAQVTGDREQFYLETLLPFKLKGYLNYLQARNWWSDLEVLGRTIIAVVFPNKAPLPTMGEIRSFTNRHHKRSK
jgi:lipopolysaccharide/colanic/teichoic acid biosynthesis glycosyltransferase